MREVIRHVIQMWSQYWSGGFYSWLLLLSALYLLIFKSKEKTAKLLLSYTAILLAVLFFPVTARIIQACIGADVYWRVFWLLPTVFLVPYAGICLVDDFGKKRLSKAVVILLVPAAMVLCGKSVWQAGNYAAVHNYQQVPDEVAQICTILQGQKEEGEEIYLATTDHLASYIRVFDPSIHMVYGRGGKGGTGRRTWLYQEMNSPTPKLRRIARIFNSLEIRYMVHPAFDKRQKAYLAKKGFRLIGTVNDIEIYEYVPQ